MPAEPAVEDVRDTIRQSTAFDRPFILRNLAATVLVCAGLIGNSSTTIIGAMPVPASGAAVGRLAPDMAPSDEMPKLTTPRLSSAIVGIAIAVTLVPPLATTALLGTRGHGALAQGAFLIAFVNKVAIQVGASTALWLCSDRSRAGRARSCQSRAPA